MKKILLCIMAILLIAGLVACGNKENEVKPAPVPSNNENQNVADNDVNENVPKTLSNEEMYGGLLEEYKNALADFDLEDLDAESKVSDMLSLTLLTHIARYSKDGVQLTSSYYDIDKNGVNELLVGVDNAVGAIYSFDKSTNTPVKIYFLDTLERGNLYIYDNGVIVSSGAGGAAIHYYEFGKLASDGVSYELLESVVEEYVDAGTEPTYKDAKTEEVLDYKSLDEITNKYIAGAQSI